MRGVLADVEVGAEPFAERLGTAWSTGFQKVLSWFAPMIDLVGPRCHGRTTLRSGLKSDFGLGFRV